MDQFFGKSETAFQAMLLEAVEHPIITTDMQGIVIYWNTAASRLFGWTKKETLGKNILDITPTNQTTSKTDNEISPIRTGLVW